MKQKSQGYKPKNWKPTKTYINDCLKDIRKATRKIQEANDKDGTKENGFHQSQHLQDLLCRVGNLEVTLNYLWELKHNKDADPAQLKPNRLCTHYDRDGEDQYLR